MWFRLSQSMLLFLFGFPDGSTKQQCTGFSLLHLDGSDRPSSKLCLGNQVPLISDNCTLLDLDLDIPKVIDFMCHSINKREIVIYVLNAKSHMWRSHLGLCCQSSFTTRLRIYFFNIVLLYMPRCLHVHYSQTNSFIFHFFFRVLNLPFHSFLQNIYEPIIKVQSTHE